MKKTKILCLVMAIAMIIGLVAGCGGNDTPSTTKGNETKAPDATKASEDTTNYAYGTVHGIDWTSSGKADQSNETAVKNQADRVAEYLAETGNNVTFEQFTYDYQSVGAMFEGGQLPTTFSISATEPVKLIKNGWGRDISAQVEQVGIKLENFNQAILDTYTVSCTACPLLLTLCPSSATASCSSMRAWSTRTAPPSCPPPGMRCWSTPRSSTTRPARAASR